MDRRLLLLLLVAILAIAATVPALGSKTTVAPTFDRKASTKALAKARLALSTARSAQRDATAALDSAEVAGAIGAAAKAAAANAQKTADDAQGTANAAKGTADGAQNTAAATQALLESTRVKQAMAKAEAETESTSYVQLTGGPSLTVGVPSSGLIEVWAQATFSEGGAVSLFEDGTMMPGQSDTCTEGALFTGGHFAPPETMGTPAVPGFTDCGTSGPPGAVMFETTPGVHTYELRYKICGCGTEPVAFSNRLLRVGPRL